ncbi:MAG: oligosaccharide repeat unit polymerase, partial [Elusimicrobiota bacterium]|nr:oligosaccharide repeat unit polymerase [Elusimicrobiota bacterium]
MFLFCGVITFYLTAAFSVKRETFRKIIYALTGAATVSAAYAVMQFAGLDFIWPRSVDPYGQRSISTFGNPNFLSSFLVISIFLIIGHIYTAGKKVKNTPSIWYMMLLINIAGLAITMTRSSYLGLAAGLVIAGCYLIKNTGKKVKKPLVIFVILIISVGGIFSLASRQFRERAVSFFSVEKMGKALTQRLMIWEASFNMFKDTPAIGRGWGNFEIFYPLYQGRIVEKENYRNLRTHANNAHNMLLELLTQAGILGTGLYIFLIVVFVKFSFSVFSKAEEKDKIWVVVFFAAAVSFWVDNLLNVSLFFPMPAIAFWVNMGLLAGLGRKVTGTKDIKFNIGKFYTPLLLLIVFFAAGVVYFNAVYFFSSVHFFNGFKYSRQGRLIAAERELEKAHSLYSLNVDNNYELGNVYARLAVSGPEDNLEKAVWAYNEALQANPGYDEIYFNLGIMYLKAGRTDMALENLRETIKINPLAEGAYRTLGDIMIREDELSRAASYYIRTLRIDPGSEAAVNNLRYLASLPRNPDVSAKLNELFSEASGCINEKDWQGAMEITGEILAIDPVNMQALLYAGN